MSRDRFEPGSPKHFLYRDELFPPASSYSEENFGGNQILDDSIGLSPLHAYTANDLHVNTAMNFHPSFLGLHALHA